MSAILSEPKTTVGTAFFVNGATPLMLDFGSLLKKMDDEDFFEFCALNKDLRIEMTAEGDIIPKGGKTGNRNFNLIGKFSSWVERDKDGKCFDSSTVFRLPNGAKHSPDVSWVRLGRWNNLTEEEQEKFPPMCPDFVIESRSRTDALATLQAKMQECIENGAQLGWLIDPLERKICVYRQNTSVEILDNPQSISGEPLLKDFTLELKAIWE